jgi:hypothetical protein
VGCGERRDAVYEVNWRGQKLETGIGTNNAGSKGEDRAGSERCCALAGRRETIAAFIRKGRSAVGDGRWS